MLFNIAVANLLINQAENSLREPPHHVKSDSDSDLPHQNRAGPILAEKCVKISPPDHFCCQNGPTGPLLGVISRGQTALFAQAGRYHFQYKLPARKSVRLY